jgi:hypothetical protein
MSTGGATSRVAWWKGVSFALSFVAGMACVWFAGARVLEFSGAGRTGMALDFAPLIQKWQREMLDDHGLHRVALLGDSMIQSEQGLPGVGERIAPLLWRRHRNAPRISVHPFAWPAWTPIGEYCIIDKVLAAKPDFVAIELNLRSVKPGPLAMFSYSELAGWIAPSHTLEALFQPLSDAGITANQLLLYQALVRAGAEPEWMALLDRQARLLNSRDVLEYWVKGRTGSITTADALFYGRVKDQTLWVDNDRGRSTKVLIERHFADLLAGIRSDSPRLVVLGTVLRRLRNAGVPTLLWVSPVNVQYFRELGIPLDGFERSMSTIGQVVESEGAVYADLHALLSDGQFRDYADHYTLTGDDPGSARVAAELARRIRDAMSQPPPDTGTEKNASHAVQ